MSILKAGKPSRKDRALLAIQDTKKVRINFDVSRSFHKQLKQRALDENLKIKELILNAVNEYLSR